MDMHISTSNGPLYPKHRDKNYTMMRNMAETKEEIRTFKLARAYGRDGERRCS
jgi:hypothetical protein